MNSAVGEGTGKALSQIRKSAEDACSTIVNLQSDILWPFWVHVEKEILPKFLRLEKYRRAVCRVNFTITKNKITNIAYAGTKLENTRMQFSHQLRRQDATTQVSHNRSTLCT